MPTPKLTAASILPYLKRCGYGPALLARDYNFGTGQVPVAAFADTPFDVRSACIAVVEAQSDPERVVVQSRPLGAPVIFVCQGNHLQWWKQTTQTPELFKKVESGQLDEFFGRHEKDFAPANIFEGKTFRRLPGRGQLSFVDAGLVPFVERLDGEQLSQLVERIFRGMEGELGRKLKNIIDIENAIRATFWLLAAKALRDKAVPNFKTLVLTNIDEVFDRVGRHYGVPKGVPPLGKGWHDATAKAAEYIDGFVSLRNLSTESLAHVYENALVTPEVRKANGTHSTPGPLVDYIVWQLWPWIEALPPERRHVFEPACGEAAFMVSALRIMRQWSDIHDGRDRHDYLRKHLHGIELDPFAIEVARLSLTLADIPYGNNWDLTPGDMFRGTALEDGAKECGVFLANPPYERFTQQDQERAGYRKAQADVAANTKACEMLRRTIPNLAEGACFGVVVPHALLHNKEGTRLRKTILSDFELAEIDVFGDRLFAKSRHEVAVWIGRRKQVEQVGNTIRFHRVNNAGMDAFRDRFAFSSEESVPLDRLAATKSADFRVPELGALWQYLSDAPTLGDDIAGQGLFHKGGSLASGQWTIHDPPRPNDVRGFANIENDLTIYGLPRVVGINISPVVIDRAVAGLPTNKPQVLLNYSPLSGTPWRLKATLDEKGLALTSRFIAVRPVVPGISALHLWALLNSPVANAFVYCHLGKRDILVGTMRLMPVPRLSGSHAAHIEQAALRYRKLASAGGPLLDPQATPEGIRQALLEMDAAVLQAYDLPPRLERQLLDFFTGVQRKGVGCEFDGYYPPGFTSFLPLHFIISDRFARAAADLTVERFKSGQSEHVREALDAAVAHKVRR